MKLQRSHEGVGTEDLYLTQTLGHGRRLWRVQSSPIWSCKGRRWALRSSWSSLYGSLFIPFSSLHYKRTSFGLVFDTMYEVFILRVKRFKLTLKGVSPVGTGVTHHRTYIVSKIYTPRLLLGALCVLHMKMLSNAFNSHVMEYWRSKLHLPHIVFL